MRTVNDIYREYRIPPWLQMHQLRVGAVGKIVAERMSGVDVQSIVAACLLHDMGNILKFDLTPLAILARLVPEGERDYWISVQKDFEAKYGKNEHHATEKIVEDIDVPQKVRTLIRDMGFSKAAAILREDDPEILVVEYADQRVGPDGILSFQDRLADGNKRYEGMYGRATPDEQARYRENIEAMSGIERRVMGLAKMQPEEIYDAVVEPVIEQLKTYRL